MTILPQTTQCAQFIPLRQATCGKSLNILQELQPDSNTIPTDDWLLLLLSLPQG